ncbi:biotin--[acetyl-CoA-carboxylase] ligase [Pedobacter sp. SYSU D00535]|uniref:biotin--[acetyl-CoA-carboxylase] ligase n=1 Tax=Pedobacter sp. SYSU D00535 TaxID=2810308 RepID=UPI001F60ED05|nr:biotin--[acetyl-CoA-carboxylase] ligase [Pedobacter sp. SYSU D00535]
MDEFNYYSAILQNNTFSGLFVGQNIVSLRQVDSTNTYLKNLLSKGEPLAEGTVIMAEEQFAGRGQVNNTWVSEPGMNLTFSILLCPSFLLPENQFQLNLAVSLAINDALTPIIGRDLKIKWPNDIYVKNQKLGGVLIENIVQGTSWKYAIVGIGINVNQVNFPAGITNVTSLKKILHQDYDLQNVLKEICDKVSIRYQQLKSDRSSLMAEYVTNLYKLNTPSRFRIGNKEVEGVITGVTEQGFLRLKIADEENTYGFKELSYIIP